MQLLSIVLTSCSRERTDLYVNWIEPANILNEMVDKIVFTYKFTNLPNIDYLAEMNAKCG